MRANTTISLQQTALCSPYVANSLSALGVTNLCTFFLTQSGLERQGEPRQTGRAAAFIDRETDGDVPSSAAASCAGGRKEKGNGDGRVLAQCPLHRMDDEQHVDTVSPFIPPAHKPQPRCAGAALVSGASRGGCSYFPFLDNDNT